VLTNTRSADFLSSIEILIADQLDVLTMQNWEHVQVTYFHILTGFKLANRGIHSSSSLT
jgi:hypothetical protein